MKLILKNGRTFIVKVRYDAIDKESFTKDKFNRDIEMYWTEHKTTVTVEEVDTKKMSSIVFKGYSYCSYKDHYSKKTGKELAYFNAVNEMLKANVINPEELNELNNFKLDKWITDNRR